ncbi:unnamed protein product [Prunus brigantina]
MSHSDPSLFLKYSDSSIVVLLLYVDDIILTESNPQIIHESGMSSCKPCPTPLKPHIEILLTDGIPLKDPNQYHSIVGALQYLTFTRSDIAHYVNIVDQFMNNPTEHHFFLVKRILHYLQGTLRYGFTYSASGPLLLSAYSDSD